LLYEENKTLKTENDELKEKLLQMEKRLEIIEKLLLKE
jgi:hypothetical protein